MSTPADIVKDLSSLLDELAKLLETDTAREVPNIALDLGAQPQLFQGVDAMKTGLDKIRAGVVPLQKGMISADALVALIGFAPPMVLALGDAIKSSGAALDSLGLGVSLGEASKVAGQIAAPIEAVSGVLSVGVEAAEGVLALAAPEEWTGVVASLDHLGKSLLELKKPPAPPA